MARYQIVVLRFTPRQIRTDPAGVIQDIRQALNSARGRPSLNLRTVPANTSANANASTSANANANTSQLDKGAA